MSRRGRWIVVIASFLWLAFVYGSFYLVQQQRPFDGENLRAIASVLLDLVAASAILFVGAGLGHSLCRWLGVSPLRPGELLVMSCGVGLGALSFLFLALGLLGWLAQWVMLLLLAVLAILLLGDLAAIGRTLGSVRSLVGPGRGLGLYLTISAVLVLLVALSPPLDWDGLFYHLTLPRLYIEQGRVAPVTDMPHQHFPGMMEMLYMGAMILKGDVAAKLLHFGYMLLLGGMVYLLAERHVGAKHAWPAVIVYSAIPMVSVLGSWAYNDLALALYQAASLYALLNWMETKSASWLVLSGVFCGLALGLKYTAFVCPLVLLGCMLWHLVRERRQAKRWVRSLLLCIAVVMIVAVPWYAQNLANTGNPVYPFAYDLFGGRGWDPWRGEWYAQAGTGLGKRLGEWIALPWTLTLGLRDMNFYDGRVGPLFLLALPFLVTWCVRLWGRPGRRPWATGYLCAFAAAQFAAWSIGVGSSRSLFQSRLLLPALVALCPLLAYLFDELQVLDLRFLSLRRLIGMSVVLVLAANLGHQFLDVLRLRPVPMLVGEESRSEFLSRNLGAHYAAMQLVNDRVPSDGRALFLWEPRSYYCERPCQPDPILERWAWLHHRLDGDNEAIARALDDEGYTHLLVHQAGLDFVRRDGSAGVARTDLEAWDAFAKEHLAQVGEIGDAYSLYLLEQE